MSLQARLRDPAMRVRDAEQDVAAIVLAGTVTGAWPEFVGEVARRVALQRKAVDPPSPVETRERVRALRRRRDLLSRTDLRNWLSARALASHDLTDVARRELLGERHPDGAPPPLDDEVRADVARTLWPELACSGALRELGVPLALGLVAERRLGEPAAPPPASVAAVAARAGADTASGLSGLAPDELLSRARRVCALVDHGRRLLAGAADPAAVAGRLRERRLEWRSLVVDELRLPHEGAAREACAQARLEGRELRDVALAHGFHHRRRQMLTEDTDPAVRSQLLAARVGDVIGPVAIAGHHPFLVIGVEAAESPGADLDLEARARSELEREAVARALAGAVTWLDPY